MLNYEYHISNYDALHYSVGLTLYRNLGNDNFGSLARVILLMTAHR